MVHPMTPTFGSHTPDGYSSPSGSRPIGQRRLDEQTARRVYAASGVDERLLAIAVLGFADGLAYARARERRRRVVALPWAVVVAAVVAQAALAVVAVVAVL